MSYEPEMNARVTVCKLPRDMNPGKEAFEALGFTFEDIGDNILYKATLPKGWSIKTDDVGSTALIDDKGRNRGHYFYRKGENNFGYMCLTQRFWVEHNYVTPGEYMGPVTVYARDADGKIIFEAGHAQRAFSDEFQVLWEEAKMYLNTNYPGWEDARMYWD